MKRVLVFVASTLVLSACSKVNLPNPFNRGADRLAVGPLAPPTPVTDAYLRAAGESDLYEVTSSQLAIQRTQNPDVRRFATRMIDHHTGTTNALLAAARKAGIAPPPIVLGRRSAR
jgi:putative membrane protein